MKKFTKILVLALVLISLVVAGCEKEELQNDSPLKRVEIIPNIGNEHNEGLDDFLDAFNRDKKENMTNSDKINYMKGYFQKNYNADISPIINVEIENLKNKNIDSISFYENIDIDGFVSDISVNFSPYFREQLDIIKNKVRIANNDTIQIKKIINEYLSKAENDNNFAPNEREYFINSLYVFNSSVTYWYTQDFGTKVPEPDDMWKIPVSDWTGGLIGLLGGPGGAVIGYLSGSALAAIGLW